MKVQRLRIPAAVGAMILALGVWASPATATSVTDLPSLSAVDGFAVFGKTVNLSKATVNGDVGVSRDGRLTFMASSTVNGDLYLDSGVTIKKLDGPYGTLYEPWDLSAARDQVFAASATLAWLTPDVTYASWTCPLTIAGNGGVNVIEITGDVDLNKESVTLTGGPNDIFVINVHGGFTLHNSGGVLAGSGMDASRILINIIGTGAKVTGKAKNEVDGTLLLPYREMEFYKVSGAIYGGDQEIKLMSDKTIDYVPFGGPLSADPPVPEPVTLVGFGAGLAGVACYLRKRFAR